jgi:stage IV sporulation protein FB
MENIDDPKNMFESDSQSDSADEQSAYPPKYEIKDTTSNIWLRSIISLAAYLVLGYYIFPNYKILILITAIVMIHELGHFFAMKYFRYNELGIFFIPLLGAYVSGTKREVSQKQSAVILLAGPLPGIIIGAALHIIDQNSNGIYFLDISLSRIGLLFILLNLINLFPVYPLDGGQLLNRVFLDEEGHLSKLFVFLSAAFMCWVAIQLKFYILFIFPAMMLLRFFGEKKFTNIEKRIELAGIHTDLDYEDLPDEDYWKIRNILIEEHPSFKDVVPAPPFEFSKKEDKIMTTIQSLLHRHLIQDVSIAGKFFIFLIWVAGIASPWLLNMDMSFFSRFGF